MKMNRTGLAIISCLFILSAVVSWKMYFKKYVQKDTVNIHEFPREIAGWTSVDIPLTEEEYAILETKNAFTRRYKGPDGQEIYLLMVYSQTNRKVSHPPEICYTGSGASIVGNEPASFEVPGLEKPIRANKLTLEYGRVLQLSYYWFKVGDEYTSNYWKQQLLIAVKSLFDDSSSSALIRIASTVGEGGKEKAEESIRQFARLVVPLIPEYLP